MQVVAEGEDIVYTYDVYWQESDVEWASRWDAYLRMPNGTVHWFSILNSLLVVLVMSVIVAVILMRTVRRDLAKYEELLVEGQVPTPPPTHPPCQPLRSLQVTMATKPSSLVPWAPTANTSFSNVPRRKFTRPEPIVAWFLQPLEGGRPSPRLR